MRQESAIYHMRKGAEEYESLMAPGAPATTILSVPGSSSGKPRSKIIISADVKWKSQLFS